jgi:CHAD domain-containing protein
MRCAPAEKWVEDATLDDRTPDVAVGALRGRLGAVFHWLRQAACNAEKDAENVHRLRVWSRRATAALRLFAELLPRRRTSWVRRRLKRVRRAANDARDCDVLAARLARRSDRGARRWLEAVRRERAEAQNSIIAIYERLERGDRFARRIDKLLRRVQENDDHATTPARFGDWARDRLRPIVERFFASAPAGGARQEELHQFRIRGKELRYALEVLRGAFPPDEHARLYGAVRSIQDRLGGINDLATAKARLRKKIEAAHGDRAAAPWRRLLAEEQDRLRRARQAFHEWCNPAMLRQLHMGFEALLNGSAAPRTGGRRAARKYAPIDALAVRQWFCGGFPKGLGAASANGAGVAGR